MSAEPTPLPLAGPRTLAIDVGGTGLKMLVLDAVGDPLNERARELTPEVPTPAAVMGVLEGMIESQPEFDRVSVGFPGVIQEGVTWTAANLHPDWVGFDLKEALQKATGKPTMVANDADVQGLAVIDGVGVEMVITLGTGLGSGLYVDGKSVRNFELAHHPFRKSKTYEEYLGGAALDERGKTKWNERLEEALALVNRTFNPRMLYLGGGNARRIKFELPENAKIVPNVAGLLGGIKLWDGQQGE